MVRYQRIAAGLVLICLLLSTAGCQMALFEKVKRQVEAYETSLTGTPVMAVSKGVTMIADSDTVSIGTEVSGATKNVTFSVENNGTAPLELNGSPRVVLSGVDVSEFGIVSLPASVVNPGGKSDFVISFSPVGSGGRSASIAIPNSTSQGAVFSFDIDGEGVVGAGGEIQVSQSSTVIDDTPGYEADFGFIASGTTSDLTFTITNIGTTASLLHLVGTPRVAVTGADAGQFTVVSQPDDEYLIEGDPLSGSSDFVVRYAPDEIGDHTATISIANDEVNADEIPYTFTVVGSSYSLDVAFLLDTSGSMGPYFAQAQNGILQGISAVQAIDPGANFGLAQFDDFPIGSFGIPGYDVPYQREADLDSNTAVLSAVLGALMPVGGADIWASTLDAFAGAAGVETMLYGDGDGAADGMSWRTGSIRVAILISNSPPHNFEYFASGYPGMTLADTIDALNAQNIAAAGILFNGSMIDMTMSLLETSLCPATDGAWSMSGDFYSIVASIVEQCMAAF